MVSTGETYRDLGGELLHHPRPRTPNPTPRRPAPTPRPQRHAHRGGRGRLSELSCQARNSSPSRRSTTSALDEQRESAPAVGARPLTSAVAAVRTRCPALSALVRGEREPQGNRGGRKADACGSGTFALGPTASTTRKHQRELRRRGSDEERRAALLRGLMGARSFRNRG